MPPQAHIPPSGRGSMNIAGTKIDYDKTAMQNFFMSMKNQMGIGEPERNASDTYERNKRITPDCIAPAENEIPVRQYNVAVLRNLLRFERAEGRIQITNKRILFRAAGRSLGGRTTFQEEFDINEIAGLEAVRNYRFSLFHLITGSIIASIAYFIALRIILSGVEWGWGGSPGIFELFAVSVLGDFNIELSSLAVVLGLIFGFGGLVPFFMVKKKFLIKLIFLGFSIGGFVALNLTGNAFIIVLTIIAYLIYIFGLLLHCLRPNLVLYIMSDGVTAAPIALVRARGFGDIFQSNSSAAAGFSEVMPTLETERAIREIGAIISDIRKLGDMGVGKWRQ